LFRSAAKGRNTQRRFQFPLLVYTFIAEIRRKLPTRNTSQHGSGNAANGNALLVRDEETRLPERNVGRSCDCRRENRRPPAFQRRGTQILFGCFVWSNMIADQHALEFAT
jgi:hypothetical protein